MTARIKRIRVAGAAPDLGINWAVGHDFALPDDIMEKLTYLKEPPSVHLTNRIPEAKQVAEVMRDRCAYTKTKPASSRLPFSYQKIPPVIRKIVAHLLGGIRRKQLESTDSYPAWPLDLTTDFLSDLANVPNKFSEGPTHVILSHDLDSAEGLENMDQHFSKLEQSFSASSMNYLVPCGWDIDHKLVQNIADAGHTIGIHGYDHANISPYLQPAEMKDRLDTAQSIIKKYNVKGYRAPSLLRTKPLFDYLQTVFEHDSSIPTSGGMFPVPDNGCATARPYMIGDIVEIPLSMPRDGSLRFLGYSPNEIFDLWVECAERIADSGGVVVLLTHCERRFSGNSKMLEIYKRFLEYVAESKRLAFSTMDDVVKRYKGQ